jgi:hypothetical protein
MSGKELSPDLLCKAGWLQLKNAEEFRFSEEETQRRESLLDNAYRCFTAALKCEPNHVESKNGLDKVEAILTVWRMAR